MPDQLDCHDAQGGPSIPGEIDAASDKLGYPFLGATMNSDLADFIHAEMRAILAEWETYASTLLPAGARMSSTALRDHAQEILEAIQTDLRTPQTREEEINKSHGLAVRADTVGRTAAETHALLRVADGFTLEQLVAEYRALRASVLRLWAESHPTGRDVVTEVGRFNEAIDQALAESVVFFNRETERWRYVFLGVLAHELRGPLEAVLLTSELVKRLAADTPASEATERLIRNGRRMSALLDDLLEFNRSALGLGIPVHRQACDLAVAVQEEVDLRRASLPGVVIDLSITAPCPGAWDASRMKQVVGNLVSNAARHGTAGASIGVLLETKDTEVRLAVQNTGPAIAPEMQKVIFQPLRRGGTSGPKSGGMGLGLFIAREIVRGHGGRIVLASNEGNTVFTAVLPR
ncbi:sensor histidine kinase [Aquincola sp. MAHUQ-54]|uniref:histidine kinase n=1 Tax=Aquincola agrisoli TaxID=3119538 RepID=A0AAW9QGF2_9BURK